MTSSQPHTESIIVKNLLILWAGLAFFSCAADNGVAPAGSPEDTGTGDISKSDIPAQDGQVDLEPGARPLETHYGRGVDGRIVEEYQFYRNGAEHVKHGYYKSFWQNGNRKEEGGFKEGKKDGTWTYFADSGSEKISEDAWGEGRILYQATFYPNGNLRSESTYSDRGEVTIYYYENGNREREGVYKNGREDGLWIWYYENGNKKEEGFFREGKWDGTWTWYREDGTLQYERAYWNGIERGVWTWWDEHGNKTRQEIWQEGYRVEEIDCSQNPQGCAG